MKNKKNILTAALTLTVLLTFSAPLLQANAENSSVIVSAKLPWKLTQSAAIWDGKNAYVFGGGNEAGPMNSIVKYNPTDGQVSVMTATLPERVTDNCAIWNGRYAFIFGGWTGQPIYSNKISRYDPTTDTVTVMSAKLPTYSMSAIWDGTNAYLFGGYDGYSCYSHILRYNPSTDQLTTMKAKLPTGIKWTSAVWTGTYAYIFGGYPYSDQIVRYDPTADSVTVITSKLPQKLIFTSAVWTGTYALIFGGASASNIMSGIMKFEPAQYSITIIDQTLPSPRLGTSAVWDGGAAYLFGGNNHDSTGDVAYDDIIQYTPSGTPNVSPSPPDVTPTPTLYPSFTAVQTKSGTVIFSWSNTVQNSQSFSITGTSITLSVSADVSLSMPVGVTAKSNATNVKDAKGALITTSISSQSSEFTLTVSAEASVGSASQSVTRTLTKTFSTPLGASSEAVFDTIPVPALDLIVGQATIDLTPKFSLVGYALADFDSNGPCSIDQKSIQCSESGTETTMLVTINKEEEIKVFLASPSLTITQLNLGVDVGASIRPIIGDTYSVDLGSLQLPVQSDIQITGSPSSTLLAEYLLPTPSPTPTETLNQKVPIELVGLTIIVAVIVAIVIIAIYRKRVTKPKKEETLPKAQPPEGKQVCPNCGAVLPAGSKFCGKCGTPLQ
jgi:hypothetical protein